MIDMAKKRNHKNAGRKKETDPKDRLTIFVKRSHISGKNKPLLDPDSDEYKQAVEVLKNEIYETIIFNRG